MSTDFSPVAYRSLLGALLDRGYDVRGYADAVPDQRHLILRHDIDLSLDAALPIAEIERALGLKAHYFVLVRTELYNLFSAAGRNVLRRLTALGHDIGLHLDASLYDNATAMLGKAADEECAVLAAATGAPVTVISFHRPAQALLGYPDTLAGRVHAYQPRFFTQMGYCSDSRGAWHYGHPFDHAAVREGRALQLLTHPVWWHGDVEQSVVGKLDRFLGARTALLCDEVARNCKPYRDALAAQCGRNVNQRTKP